MEFSVLHLYIEKKLGQFYQIYDYIRLKVTLKIKHLNYGNDLFLIFQYKGFFIRSDAFYFLRLKDLWVSYGDDFYFK